MCVGMVFDLLGWEYDTAGPKADAFSDQVLALGVCFDLSPSEKCIILVHNAEKRKDTLMC